MTSPLEEEPPNLSFSLRGNHNNFFPRSNSTKEQSIYDPIPLPPRLSSASIPTFSLHQNSLPSTHHQRPNITSTLSSFDSDTYQCISSVLKRDGQIICLAVSSGLIYSGSQGNVIRVWKLPNFTECGQLKTKACMVVALQVCNNKVYAAYSDCRIRVWIRTWEGTTVVKHVRLATVPTSGSYIRSYISGKDKMRRHLGPITSLAINQLDDLLYSASLDKTVRVWRISGFKCIEVIQAHLEPINALVVSEDGVLYTASDDATIRVWHRNYHFGTQPHHSLVVTLPAKYSPVKALALAADGRVLYGGCTDGYVHYWLKGWFSGQLQYGGALQGHTHAVMCLATLANYAVSGSADLTSRVWVREPDGLHTCVAILQGHKGPIRCLAVSLAVDDNVEEDCTICTGSVDGILKVWRVRNATSQARDS